MIRNLSLTLEHIAESTAKAIDTQQKYLDSLAKFVLGNRLAIGYLLAEQGGVWAVVNITHCTWINTSREIETQLHKLTEQDTWLKKMTPSVRSFLDLFDFDCLGLGDHDSKVHSKRW